MFVSAAAKALMEAILRPNEWEFDQYTATHVPSKTVMWCGNGGFFFDGWNYGGTQNFLGLFERHIAWRKMQRLRNEYMARMISSPPNIQP